MEYQNDPGQGPVGAAAPVQNAPVAGTSAQPQTYSEAIEIATLCTLAGQSQRIAEFLENNTPLASVRTHLLALQAQSVEISSRLAPAGVMPSAYAATANSPLLQAAQARAGVKPIEGRR